MHNKFLEYLEKERGYSPHTRAAYKKDIEDFLAYFPNSEWADLPKVDSQQLIRLFLQKQISEKKNERSINRKLSSLRSFYQFLLKIGETTENPFDSFENLKISPKKQIPFNNQDLAPLTEINWEELAQQDFRQYLEIVMLETLYQTGMRRSEIISLERKNYRPEELEIRVLGKGKKWRSIPILKDLVDKLHPLDKILSPERLYLFEFPEEKHFQKKIYEKFVYLAAIKYFSNNNDKPKVSPHILRHSFATHMLDQGAEINEVKKLLGHSSLAATQVYTAADIGRLKKIVAKTHPRNNNNPKI